MLELLNRPHADPYKFPLTDGFLPVFLIVGAYLYFVLSLGRQFMFQRQPYDLKNVLKVYNLAQVIYNGSMFILGTYFIVWVQPYNLSCLEIQPLDHPLRMLERLICYTYYINKYVDLLDTIFIVLRKNYKQISVLHLVHHVYMTVGAYFYFRYNGFGGHVVVLGYLNVLVHFVMYGYYYFSSQYPHMKQSLLWKKYITILQMVQFVLILAHNVWTHMQPDCGVGGFLIYLTYLVATLMLVMFINFYIQSYIRPKGNNIHKKPSVIQACSPNF